jgi:predicted ABC-type transport system involved in lysophospholipase L1 biosynthesis ATPase subunit
VTAMLGNAGGPQAYLRQVGMGQALAESGTEILAGNQASDAVATVFRTQAHKLLVDQPGGLIGAVRPAG